MGSSLLTCLQFIEFLHNSGSRSPFRMKERRMKVSYVAFLTMMLIQLVLTSDFLTGSGDGSHEDWVDPIDRNKSGSILSENTLVSEADTTWVSSATLIGS